MEYRRDHESQTFPSFLVKGKYLRRLAVDDHRLHAEISACENTCFSTALFLPRANQTTPSRAQTSLFNENVSLIFVNCSKFCCTVSPKKQLVDFTCKIRKLVENLARDRGRQI